MWTPVGTPFAVSLAHTSGTSCVIVDHGDNERTIRVELLWKAARSLMSTCRDSVGTVSVNHWTPVHDLFTGLAQRIRVVMPDLKLCAALVPVMEAFRVQLTSGHFLGRVWTHGLHGLEVRGS